MRESTIHLWNVYLFKLNYCRKLNELPSRKTRCQNLVFNKYTNSVASVRIMSHLSHGKMLIAITKLRSTTVIFALFEKNVVLLIRCLGMGCRAHRIFCPRLVNILLLGVAITTLHITWRLYYLGTNVKPICGVKETIIRDFHKQWCRMHRWRVDWETMAKPCEGQVAWNQRQVNSDRRTDARRSFIKGWEILPAGK